MPSKFIGVAVAPAADVAGSPYGSKAFDLAQAANGVTLSLVVCALSAWLTALLNIDSLYILVVTALSLLIANFAKPVVRHVSAEFELGLGW